MFDHHDNSTQSLHSPPGAVRVAGTLVLRVQFSSSWRISSFGIHYVFVWGDRHASPLPTPPSGSTRSSSVICVVASFPFLQERELRDLQDATVFGEAPVAHRNVKISSTLHTRSLCPTPAKVTSVAARRGLSSDTCTVLV